MPNHCHNLLEFVGTKEELEEVKCYLRDAESAISFNKVIPQPDNVSQEPVNDEVREACAAKGQVTWYDWNIEHWGTKWDAYSVVDDPDWLQDVVDREDDENLARWAVAFDSAWGPPDPVMAAISRKFPTVMIRHSFVIECGRDGMGMTLFYGGKGSTVEFSPIDVMTLTNTKAYVSSVGGMIRQAGVFA